MFLYWCYNYHFRIFQTIDCIFSQMESSQDTFSEAIDERGLLFLKLKLYKLGN